MKTYIVLFIAILFFAAKVNGQVKSYFPVAAKPENGISEFEQTWFSKQLSAMDEPVLFTDKSITEVYRFTWLRTFHHPVAIRIEKRINNYILHWKLCDGTGGYKPGNLTVNKSKIITQEVWDKFKNYLLKAGFWKMPSSINESGDDGAQWILEGKEIAKYHVVDRWTPTASSNFYKSCDYLIGLTDLKIARNEKY